MTRDKKLKEEYLQMNGWVKEEGYCITDFSLSDTDRTYITKDQFRTHVYECVFWWNEDYPDTTFQDLDEAVEYEEGTENHTTFKVFKDLSGDLKIEKRRLKRMKEKLK